MICDRLVLQLSDSILPNACEFNLIVQSAVPWPISDAE